MAMEGEGRKGGRDEGGRGCINAAVCSTTKEKESQWVALKMMMAERAADCLAKLGLDSQQPPAQTVAATSVSANSLEPNFHHRRCRSLRERTGVDHRLERLPSGSMHRTPLHTVMHTSNSNISRPVRIEDFAEHVAQMSRDSEFHFSEEYELLKNVGCGQSNSAAEAPVNRTKNRFTNILPYDHSRVKLVEVDEEDGSDYINANFMPGFSSRREFIAAQGPLPSTRDAFWQVTLLCETHYDEFTVRELRLTSLKDPQAVRTIRHFHYQAWPDFGVPEHPDGILRLARLFRAKLPHSPQNKPTIVHCSAGVGRSGTFIAIDRLLQYIQLSRPVDVFGIVNEMRMERCHMVQNEQQYIFIHHAILYAIQQGGSSADWQPTTNTLNGEIHHNPGFQNDEDEGIVESGF
ncbi:hypothetical protein WR25_13325 [Diploscapter pachys]|uniref:Protein-tyrosine-phosphatase n=1 Tax=Diploscapter pachys TaxID=2018661 RepID=A0A2A2LV79_9BILA|nr:hypothetical protein WR25_13325 [Diploscapter pachys]